jgi:hypothetical protein
MARRLLLFALLAGCSAGTDALVRRTGPEYEAEVASWMETVKRTGGDGEWLVVRGYHATDDLIAVATDSPLSHAAILDLSHMQVIEAVGAGVVVVPLEKILRESHRVQLVRPRGWTPEAGRAAVDRARAKAGAGYDFLGLVGAPDEERFYCSELAVWSMELPVDRAGPQNVLHPRNLHTLGDVLFDSGARDGQAD